MIDDDPNGERVFRGCFYGVAASTPFWFLIAAAAFAAWKAVR